MKNDILRRNSGMIWNTAGNFIYLFGQWLITIVIVRVTNYSDAGVFSLAMTLSSVFVIISNYGMRPFQVTDVKIKHSDVDYSNSRVVTVVLGAAVCLITSLLFHFSAFQILAINIYMIYKGAEAYADVLYGVCQKYGRLDFAGISLSIKGIINFATFLVSFLIFKNLCLSLLIMSISSIAVMLLYDIPKAKLFSMRLLNFNNNAIGKTVILLRKCFMMVILMLINPALMAIPRIFVERLHGSDKLGIYSAISSPTIVISTLASCVLLSILPKYAEYYFDGNKKSLIRIILYPVVVLLLFGVFCVIIAHLLGAWFLGLIYGEGILPYIPLLEQVVIVTVLSSVLMCYNSIFIASRRLIPLLLFSITGFLICLALSPLFVGRYDIYGAAEVLICSQLIQIVAMSFYIWRIVRKMEPALIQQKEVEKED